jgi:hypothetical protein
MGQGGGIWLLSLTKSFLRIGVFYAVFTACKDELGLIRIIYICTYVRMYVWLYVYTYVCMYVCMYVYTYVYTYIYTNSQFYFKKNCL